MTLQLPIRRAEGIVPGSLSRNPIGWHTGILCPRCHVREIIYNGNYFCAGFGEFGEVQQCGWALPHTDEAPHFTEPHHVDLQNALINSQKNRPNG